MLRIAGQEYMVNPEDDKISLRFYLNIKESTIEKIYTFYGNTYHIDLQIKNYKCTKSSFK